MSKGRRDTESVPLRRGLSINDYAGVMRAAVGAMGIAEMPSIMCRQELRQGLIVPVMSDWQFEEVNLSAYYLSRRHPSRLVELFLAHAPPMQRTVSSCPPRQVRTRPSLQRARRRRFGVTSDQLFGHIYRRYRCAWFPPGETSNEGSKSYPIIKALRVLRSSCQYASIFCAVFVSGKRSCH